MAVLLNSAFDPLRRTIFQTCPGGLCAWIQTYSTSLLVLLILTGALFKVTLIPFVFSWRKRKPDGKKRICLAFLACCTFYFWLTFLALNSIYCFGFLAHEGPCKNFERNSTESSENVTTVSEDFFGSSSSANDNGSAATSSKPVNESCEGQVAGTPHQKGLWNITLINGLIIVVLIIVLLANAREALTAKALHYNETLVKREEVQKFLSSLVAKPPEVGHYVTCFHAAKSSDSASEKGGSTNNLRKVVTYSAIENFQYQSWRDFSDVRLIDPSPSYPIIEIEVVLNFFPGDHPTAEKYKAFVMQLTKEHSGKDAKINIDDYFHLEDRREWTFFIGNPDYISPWWDHGFSRFLISCVFFFGWPFRMNFGGQIAKHQVEVKKAVFCENSSQDEGVSLTAATPGSGSNETNPQQQQQQRQNSVVDNKSSSPVRKESPSPTAGMGGQEKKKPETTSASTSPQLQLDAGLRQHEHLVNAVISNPPMYQQATHQPSSMVHPQQTSHPLQFRYEPQIPPQRSVPLTSPRTHLRETTKDIVNTVTTHQRDINGVNAVNTIALKDIDVQMSALSGYETYV